MNNFHLLILACILLYTNADAQGIPCQTESKIDQVKAQHGLTGDGVLTIMMDRGIDYRHPDFIDNNGNTRIAYIYDIHDQSGAGDADNPLGFGTIFDSGEINASLQSGGAPLTNDIFGHGTATTGIMSGNGSAVSPADQFSGVASEATIISIAITRDYVPPFGSNPGQTSVYDANLLTYAFQFAELKITELNLPSVTLLNVGSIGEPTDGSIPLCTMISNYVANGNTFVCGVGDDGGKENHLITDLIENQNTEIIIEKGENGNLRFVGWYPESDRFEFSIERPNGQIEGPYDSPSSATDAQDHFPSLINIYHRGADVEFSSSSSPLRQLLIDFFGENGTYKIIINPSTIGSNGRVNAFLNPAYFYNNNSFTGNNNPGGNINSYAACPASISPGDYVATNEYIDINGILRTRNNEGAPGELWLGSSAGPTMDGRLGIDIVAPGELAHGAYSLDSYYGFFSTNTLQNSQGYYGIQNAVSAAAPLTAGVIALMLEVNPMLSPEEVKTILQESARGDSFTGNVPNEHWGYGKLDALAAINQTYQTVSVDEQDLDFPEIFLSPNPAFDHATLSIDEISSPYSIDVFDPLGRRVFSKTGINESEYKLYQKDFGKGWFVVQISFENYTGLPISKVLIFK